MKKFYIKSKKHFKLLLTFLFMIIFIVANIILMNRYGVTTVSAYGFMLSVLIGAIVLIISFSILVIGIIYYLIKKSIGYKK